jgi:hypothetical protein
MEWSEVQNPAFAGAEGGESKKTLQRGLTAVLWAARLKTYSLKYKING